MLHKLKKRKYAHQTLASLYGINSITSRKIIGLLELHPQAFERHLFRSKCRDRLRYILASLRIDFKLRLIVFTRICLQVKLRTSRGIKFVLGLPTHGQRTHANGKTAKRRGLANHLPFRFRRYAAFAKSAKSAKIKEKPRKNIKKKISITKQKKLNRPKQKIKKKKKD